MCRGLVESQRLINFHDSIAFDPGADFDAFLKRVPARWVVYLLGDADERPVQLLCVKNLRYSLKRRLVDDDAGPEGLAGPSRRIDYRQIVRRVWWRRVDSAFEADVVYLESARQFFPQTYRAMTGLRPAWFLHVDPDAEFPRYARTTDLSIRSGMLIGPVEDRQTANELIEQVADWFDLCRYYHILTEAPHGLACAYKEMGRCPAPCDGSISMDQYRRLVQISVSAVVAPRGMIEDQKQRMQAAAGELRFETAARIKAHVDSLSRLGTGPYRHLRPLRDFRFLTFQPGPREGQAKAFLITPGEIEELAGVPFTLDRPAGLIELARSAARERETGAVDDIGADRIGVVTHHLFAGKSRSGAFVHLDELDERSVAHAYRELRKQRPAEVVDDEGVVKELQTGG
jgi:hypothetical protein